MIECDIFGENALIHGFSAKGKSGIVCGRCIVKSYAKMIEHLQKTDQQVCKVILFRLLEKKK